MLDGIPDSAASAFRCFYRGRTPRGGFRRLDSAPSYFGGNLDNWRLGKGSTIYLPVSVPGALLSVGDPHAAQGDGELSGTAIECSMTGTFQLVLHKKANLGGRVFADLTYPLIETATDWILTGFSHPNYLAEFWRRKPKRGSMRPRRSILR